MVGPCLAGLLKPCLGLERFGLLCPALLRGLAVVPLEPLSGGPLDELRHVPGFGVQDFIHVAGILAFALDVVGLGPGRLAARPAAGFRRKVINRHAASLLLLLFGSMQWPSESAPPEGWPLGQFLEEKPVSAPSPTK